MTNFLTPSNSGAGNSPDQRESRSAVKRKAFDQKLAKLRHETGKTETRIVPHRCAQTGKRFFVTFERVDPAERFAVATIEKDGGNANAGAARSAASADLKPFAAGEFDLTGCTCPWCGHDKTSVRCGKCGETVCGGRVKKGPDGKRIFTCHDGCGATGEIGSGTLIDGITPVRKALPGPKAKRLPKPDLKRLPSHPKKGDQ